MQPASPRIGYQPLEILAPPVSPTPSDAAAEAINPQPVPPNADRLQQLDTRTLTIVTISSTAEVTFAGVLGLGSGEGDLNFVTAGAVGLGICLATTALALICRRESYTQFRIGDNRAVAATGLVVSVLLGLFAAAMGSADSSTA